MSPRLRALATTVGATTIASLSCGGGQTRLNLFSTDWSDDQGASIAHIYDRVGHTPAPPSADVAIGVAGNASRIVGMRLGEGAGDKWTFAHALDSRPVVAGGAVIASGGGEIFALDAATGRLLWRRPTGGLPMLGAGDDGTLSVVAFRSAGGVGSVLLAIARDGLTVRQIETSKQLGTPAVLGHLAFVPWAGQYVSVIDPANGDEAGRVTLRQETSRAWTQSGALWFGGTGFVRFDERIRDASKDKASTVSVPTRELPGMPRVTPPGDEPMPAAANALDKTREYAKPMATDTGAALEDGRWYGTYFRLAMGFDSSNDKLAWVHMHDADILGGAAANGGIVLCDERGKLSELDAKTGGVVATLDLGEPVESCIVNADAFHVTGAAVAARPLAAQLVEAVRADEPQLVIAQKLLLRELAVSDDEIATSALVDAASDPRTSPDLLPAVRDALANRRNGASYMEAALRRHYDYLKDVLRPPPVGPLADALAAMKDKAAASLLVEHLFDPADTDDDVKRAAAALSIIAEADVAPALRQWFGMYRATAANDDVAAAVLSIADALVILDDRPGVAQVEAAQADGTTAPYARERLAAVLASRQETAPVAAPSSSAGPAPEKKK